MFNMLFLFHIPENPFRKYCLMNYIKIRCTIVTDFGYHEEGTIFVLYYISTTRTNKSVRELVTGHAALERSRK